MRAIVWFAILFISTAALRKRNTGKTTDVGGKPLVQAKPKASVGCKLVGTVKGTKLWRANARRWS